MNIKTKLLAFLILYFNIKSEPENHFEKITWEQQLVWGAAITFIPSLILIPYCSSWIAISIGGAFAGASTNQTLFNERIEKHFKDDQEKLKDQSNIISFYRKTCLSLIAFATCCNIAIWTYIYQKTKKLYLNAVKNIEGKKPKFSLSVFFTLAKIRLKNISIKKFLGLNNRQDLYEKIFDDYYFEEAIQDYFKSIKEKQEKKEISELTICPENS
jgi:hypothetical protein